MWIDENTKVTLEAVRLLGVPFSFTVEDRGRYQSAYRYKRTKDGVKLQARYLNGNGRWRDIGKDLFEPRWKWTYYLVRPGRKPDVAR